LTPLPPLPRVQLGLSQATELFAAELLHASSQPPAWTGFEWSMARAAAVLHGVAPLLAGVLRWHGPRQWESFISQQRIHTARRQRRIDELLARIDQHARLAGLALVPLKGAALHRLQIYSGGERPMADVDLLVAQRDAERARLLLQGLGYFDTSVCWKHRVFEPRDHDIEALRKAAAAFGEHAERAIKIELHTRIAERLPLNTVDVSGIILPSAPHPGLNDYPSTVALFTHLLLHAAGSMVVRLLRLIQLHDLALLAGRMRDDDWERLLAIRIDDRSLWWAVPPLELVRRYYPQVVPAAVIGALRPGCPRALQSASRRQTISQLSLTTLRMRAFPGMAWSGSMSGKLSYAFSRVLPGRDLLETPLVIKAKEGWAAHSSWAQLTHRRRILKWVLRQPARPPTMHAVHCALEQPADLAAPRPPAADEKRGAARMP
jgi:hypothetical protein